MSDFGIPTITEEMYEAIRLAAKKRWPEMPDWPDLVRTVGYEVTVYLPHQDFLNLDYLESFDPETADMSSYETEVIQLDEKIELDGYFASVICYFGYGERSGVLAIRAAGP